MDHHIRGIVSIRGMHMTCIVGITFIELLVVIALMAILLALAVPSFNAMLTNNRQTTVANAFLTSLHHGRSEAVKRNTRVALCKSFNGTNCVTSDRWDQGWVVFHDTNNNAQVDMGEAIIGVYEPLPDGFVMSGNIPVEDYVSYSATGATQFTSGAFQAGTITLCRVALGGNDAHQIVISGTGRPRIQKVNVSSCP